MGQNFYLVYLPKLSCYILHGSYKGNTSPYRSHLLKTLSFGFTIGRGTKKPLKSDDFRGF